MARVFTSAEISQDLIFQEKIGIIGYGNQGHAHALNLKDRGVNVAVGLRDGSANAQVARHAGLEVKPIAELAQWADQLMFCTPDVPMPSIYREHVEPHLRAGQLILFCHGFNVHFQTIEPPKFVDVALVSPKGPGHGLRSEFLAGRGLPSLVAVHQDSTGRALSRTLSYAWGIGCGESGVIETTFREETVTDLFGEQVVLCGGIPELVKSAFRTLVDAGYQPEVAYYECLHETKLIVDLLVARGLHGMREAISDTAEWGGYTAGERVIGEASQTAMKEVLNEIENGQFASTWIAESQQGQPELKARRQAESELEVERVGEEVRAMIPGLVKKSPAPE